MIKTYVRCIGDFGIVFLEPYEDYKWTGRYKIVTTDRGTSIHVERWITFFGLFPLCRTWVSDNDFIFRDELIVDCEDPNGLLT